MTPTVRSLTLRERSRSQPRRGRAEAGGARDRWAAATGERRPDAYYVELERRLCALLEPAQSVLEIDPTGM
jgi:hypothetical protein